MKSQRITHKKGLNKPKWLKHFVSGLVAVFLAIYLPYNAVFAGNMIYESFVEAEPYKSEFIGAYAGGQFGAVMSTGDFNGDGIDDLAVGSPFASISSKQWNGLVNVIFGTDDMQASNVDLNHTEPSLTFFGEYSGDAFGSSLASGDFNNDGIDDLVIGSYNAYLDNERPGKVYVIYGKKKWHKTSIDLNGTDPDVLFIGHDDKDEFGSALKILDVNDDGRDDLIIGAPSAKNTDGLFSGAAYAYFGSNNGFLNKIFELDKRLADITFYGKDDGERFGSAIDGGDISKSGRIDLFIGAYKSDTENYKDAGKVYFYMGSEATTQVKQPTAVIEGTAENDWFGFSISVGDLQNDGVDDVAISALSYKKGFNNSHVSIFFGGSRFEHENSVLYDSEQFRNILINDPVEQMRIGAGLLLKDVNRDKKADILIGAPGIGNPVSSNAGDLYVIFSNPSKYEAAYSIKNQNYSLVIHGAKADDWFGYFLSVMDMNGDGQKDIVVSSRYSDQEDYNDAGRVYVLLGHSVQFGDAKMVSDEKDRKVTRGEFIRDVLKKFDIETKKTEEITKCNEFKNFCLYNFQAMSSFDDLSLDPLVLYPDVKPESKYYDDVNTATMMNLMNGFMNEKQSPFFTDRPISRIQALKVILAANDLVTAKYKAELVSSLGSDEKLLEQPTYFVDVNPKISHMWWYPRYTNFAVENNIIDQGEFFRPDDDLTVAELDAMIEKTLNFLKQNEETES